MQKRGEPSLGPRRGDRKLFPYEATFIAGKLLLPADVQRLHQFMLDSETVRSISDEMRAAVEALWPDLVYKLPPKTGRDEGWEVMKRLKPEEAGRR